jgi:hypothetical protein
MAATEWLAILRRRWYVLVSVILCTGAVAWVVHYHAMPYQGCEELYLSGPASATGSYLNGNPIYGSSSVVVTAATVVQAVTAQPAQQELGRLGVSRDYTVIMINTGDPRFPTYSQPAVQICAPAASSRGALRSIEEVAGKFQAVLRTLQGEAHVPVSSLITASAIIPPSAGPVTGRPSQAEAGILLTGSLVGFALMARTDRLLRRNRSAPQSASRTVSSR